MISVIDIVKTADYDYELLKATTDKLCAEFSFLKRKIAGISCFGREIPYFKLGRGKEYILWAAAFHGSERITIDVLLKFMQDVCVSVREKRPLCGVNLKNVLEHRGMIFVPSVNPDGVEIALYGAAAGGKMAKKIKEISKGDTTHWNANLRGVDINHNFGAGWEDLKKLEIKNGITSPSLTRFGGYAPFSEPETLAISELCENYYIKHAVALHSQGEVIYWDYKDFHPKKARIMAEIMASVSGYKPASPEGLAVGGGFKDWFTERFSRPAFTVEVGLGENPLPSAESEKIYEKIREMLTLTAVM